ncbi:hypothetical protein M9458_030688, partial [Cirrhinus mrigala]
KIAAAARALTQRKNRSAGFRAPRESARSKEKGRERADPSLTRSQIYAAIPTAAVAALPRQKRDPSRGEAHESSLFFFRREPSESERAQRERGPSTPSRADAPASPRALIQRGKNRSAGFRTQKESARSREKGRDRADPSLTLAALPRQKRDPSRREEPSGNEAQPPRELTQPASPRALIQRGKDRSAGFRTPKESARSREKGRDRADPSLTRP